MKQFIKSLLPGKVLRALRNCRNNYLDGYSLKSYSQEGEDMILRRLFEGQATGFYVDVGAHHPFRFSNTYLFYKMGWKGMNIDAMPGSMTIFRRFRPRDINIESAISKSGEVLTYYVFNEPALNTFSRELAKAREEKDDHFVIQREVRLQTSKLSEILGKHLPADTRIDFMNIDVEGLDLEVLESNDWANFRPRVILVELLETSLAGIERNEVVRYLCELDYIVFAKAIHTVVFVQKE